MITTSERDRKARETLGETEFNRRSALAHRLSEEDADVAAAWRKETNFVHDTDGDSNVSQAELEAQEDFGARCFWGSRYETLLLALNEKNVEKFESLEWEQRRHVVGSLIEKGQMI